MVSEVELDFRYYKKRALASQIERSYRGIILYQKVILYDFLLCEQIALRLRSG